MEERLPLRLGIWSRLLLAFGTAAALTVIVGLVSLFILERSGALFESITEHHVPEVLKVSEFAEIAGEIVAITPKLLSANDEQSQRSISGDIDRLLQRIDRQVDRLLTASSAFKNEVERLTGDLKNNLKTLQDSISERLALQRLLARKSERLRWLYVDLIGELDPLSQDYAYNFDIELERLLEAADRQAKRNATGRIQANRTYKEAIEQIRSNGVLLVGLMSQATTSRSLAQLVNLGALTSDAVAVLQDEMVRLSDESSTVTLIQLLEDLFLLAEGDQSIFRTKTRILESEAEAQEALAGNRLYVGQLRDLIGEIVAETQTDTLAAAERSRAALSKARLLMLVMVLLSLLLTGSVLWFYVRGSIAVRLAGLSRSMLAIAAGDLDRDVPVAGTDEIGRMAAALRVFRDTALAVEEANAQAIIDNAAVGLVIAQTDGTIQFFNPMAATLFQTSAPAMVGRSIFSLVSDEEASAFARDCREVLGSPDRTPVKATFRGRRKDHSSFPMEVSICRVLQRKRERLIVTVQDITERVESERLLRTRVREKTEHLSRINIRLRDEVRERKKAQNELVQAGKLAALGQLAAGIAHEMNQPLSAMRYYLHNAEKLLERGDLDTHRENLLRLAELIERMAKMISHLKSFARMQNDRLVPVDVLKTMHQACSLVEAEIKEHGIELVFEDEPACSPVLAEPIRLEQVFVNLLANAIDAVRSNRPGDRNIAVAAGTSGDGVTITVSDNGPGIAPEHKDLIFDPFFTTKDVGQGLGLGLSLSYNIVKGFGGRLACESQRGGPTRFTVFLNESEEAR